jgi:hypothetical protein
VRSPEYPPGREGHCVTTNRASATFAGLGTPSRFAIHLNRYLPGHPLRQQPAGKGVGKGATGRSWCVEACRKHAPKWQGRKSQVAVDRTFRPCLEPEPIGHGCSGWRERSQVRPRGDSNEKALAVAYEDRYIHELYAKHGLSDEPGVHRGGWAGRTPYWPLDSALRDQDTFVATKPAHRRLEVTAAPAAPGANLPAD